jgi:hypothetical protein
MDSRQDAAFATVRALLRPALDQALGEQAAEAAIRSIALAGPALFFDVALSILESQPNAPCARRVYARLFGCPEFLIELVRPGRFSDSELVRRCTEWIEIDSFLDVRLARLAPGRNEDPYGLPAETVVRVLEVLNRISAGPRLILMLNHLKGHPNKLVAEKATVLVGRRICSAPWVNQRLASTDAGIRAGAVEGLWGREAPSARELLQRYRQDENSRVAGNALLGLHFLGEAGVAELAREMLRDKRAPFRQTAAWVMGQIGEPAFVETLTAALSDGEAGVRLSVKQALSTIRQGVPAEERWAIPRKAAAIAPVAPVAPAAEAPELALAPRAAPPAAAAAGKEKPAVRPFRFRFDGTFASHA